MIDFTGTISSMLIEAVNSTFPEWLKDGPFIFLNHCLQAIFFCLSMSSLMQLFLQFIKFPYAKTVAESYLAYIFGIIFFLYIKIWDFYNGLLYTTSVFCFVVVTFYIYDCCGNISEASQKLKHIHRQLALIINLVIAGATTIVVIYWVKYYEGQRLSFEYFGIYLLQITFIFIGHIIRRKSFLYALMGISIINYMIFSKPMLDILLKDHLIKSVQFPFNASLYLMMALTAESSERTKIQNCFISNLFKFCLNYSIFTLLNQPNFPVGLLLGGIFIFGLIINR